MPTKIEWAEESWNPVTGCTRISAGCDNCYAARMAQRLRGRNGYPWKAPFSVTVHEDKFDQPLHWRKPRMVFVCSMGDLFHKDVPDEVIVRVWNVMAYCPQHTFLVLTKRPHRMDGFLCGCSNPTGYRFITHNGHKPGKNWSPDDFNCPIGCEYPDIGGDGLVVSTVDRWPLPNVWLGTSVENEDTASERIPELLSAPAVRHFVSCEPLLGSVNLRDIPCNVTRLNWHIDGLSSGDDYFDALTGSGLGDTQAGYVGPTDEYPSLDWVICGGESGPGARPMHPDWARSLRDQCQAAGVPFFFKQWGAYSWIYGEKDPTYVTKKTAGRILDGRTWDEVPDREVSDAADSA